MEAQRGQATCSRTYEKAGSVPPEPMVLPTVLYPDLKTGAGASDHL